MIYADAETRKCWRINYDILDLKSARGAFDSWERHGGPPSGCVLALAHAIEQIDADEELLRRARNLLSHPEHWVQNSEARKKLEMEITERLP